MPRRVRNTKVPASNMSAMLRRLHRTRQEMIRPVLEQPREYVLLSIRELGAKRGVDAATVSRTIAAMGFARYREFQRYLHQLSIAQTTALDQMQATRRERATFASRVHSTLETVSTNVRRFANGVEIERLEKLAARFYKARRIIILGGDLAESLALFLQYILVLLEFEAIAATRPGHVTHVIRSANRRDLVVAISFRRGLRQTVEGAIQAKANGSYVVGITDTSVSRLARISDETFIVPIDTPPFGPSYAAAMALLDVILSAVANYRTARTLAILREAEKEQRQGFRWYPVV
jgi:RpiR family transcriptional regulator, carbohydrate utilization regulator